MKGSRNAHQPYCISGFKREFGNAQNTTSPERAVADMGPHLFPKTYPFSSTNETFTSSSIFVSLQSMYGIRFGSLPAFGPARIVNSCSPAGTPTVPRPWSLIAIIDWCQLPLHSNVTILFVIGFPVSAFKNRMVIVCAATNVDELNAAKMAVIKHIPIAIDLSRCLTTSQYTPFPRLQFSAMCVLCRATGRWPRSRQRIR
jgi:hypothetical protein